MEIREFAERIRSAAECALGEAYQIRLKEIKKNNGIVCHGLVIAARGESVSPTLYVEPFWEDYEAGVPFEELVERLAAAYRQSVPARGIDMGFFGTFALVKDRICYRLVGRKGNEALLEDVPYVEFLDLALCFYYAYQGELLREGAVLVNNAHVELWKTSTAELVRLAARNTPRLFPWECTPLKEVLGESSRVCAAPEEESGREEFVSVLSNAKKIQGAVCMLYPGVLETIASGEQRSLYLLPSSVHEMILLADTGRENAGELKRMVAEVNRTQVAPEDVLSDSLYYYDLHEKRVKIIF